jgi:ABC-type spermidine/putrescine transport system permease subunit I
MSVVSTPFPMVRPSVGRLDGWIYRHAMPLLLAPPVIAVLALLVFPVLVLFRYSLYTSVAGGGTVATPTLANYVKFFTDGYYQSSVGVTMGSAVLVTAITLLLGFPVAYAYARTGFGPKWLLLMMILSPFFIEVLVKIYAWLVLLGKAGLVNKVLLAMGVLSRPFDFTQEYVGIVIVMVYTSLPFMILSLVGPLQGIEETLVEAARVCGAPGQRVFWRVVLPLSMPGVVAGCILTFSVGIASFLVPLLIGGPIGQRFLGVIIYQAMNLNQNWSLGAVEALVLLTCSLLIVLGYGRVVRSSRVGVVMNDVMGS